MFVTIIYFAFLRRPYKTPFNYFNTIVSKYETRKKDFYYQIRLERISIYKQTRFLKIILKKYHNEIKVSSSEFKLRKAIKVNFK